MKARLMHAKYFIWTIVPITLWLVWMTIGLPHILWNYEWRGTDSTNYEKRYQTACHFIGPYGDQTVSAQDGSCGWWIRFFKDRKGR